MLSDEKKAAISKRLIELAHANVAEGGRPFACIVANSETGEILAEAANKVAQSGDPTAHAEIKAINIASEKLRQRGVATGENGGPGEDYKGYSFFILTDPCPMCMAAMHYCGPDEVVYLTTRGEYSKFYRDDRRHFKMESFYQEIAKPHAEKTMPVNQFAPASNDALKVYQSWQSTNMPQQHAAARQAAAPSSSGTASTAAATTSATSAADSGNSGGVCPHAYQPPPRQDRPETEVDGASVPAWKNGPDPSFCKRLLETDETEYDKLIDVVATQGDPYKALRLACREVHLGTRANYKDMIHNIGRNIYPLIVALDNEPGFEGVGSTFTLFLRDGSSRRIVPCPPEYEVYKGLSHISLGLFTFVSPYFRCPTGNPGWKRGMAGYHDKVKVALASAKDMRSNPAANQQFVEHCIKMLEMAEEYIQSCFDKNSVAVEDFRSFTRRYLPLIEVSVANACRLQCEAALPKLREWKQELGSQWRDVYVVIPTVWPVGGYNPRQQLFETLLEPDRVKTHIIMTEGAKDVEDARTTLGRVVGDRTVAHLVFGKETPNARALVCALSSPRDLVSSQFEDALRDAVAKSV